MKKYGTPDPPEYDLKLVTAPFYIFWSLNDPVTPPEVMNRFIPIAFTSLII